MIGLLIPLKVYLQTVFDVRLDGRSLLPLSVTGRSASTSTAPVAVVTAESIWSSGGRIGLHYPLFEQWLQLAHVLQFSRCLFSPDCALCSTEIAPRNSPQYQYPLIP